VRAVSFIVPYAAGGGTDVIARTLGQRLEQRLGKPFVIENRPGAGTVIAASAVAKAAPDGYTLLMATSSTMAINATLYKQLPYDPAKDFTPVALICSVPFILVVNPSLPVKSAANLVALAKSKPGELSYGSGGVGAPHHIFAELFKSMTGTDMKHIPYKGSAPALNDVVAGHIPLMFTDVPPAQGLIKDGRVRALGVSALTRVPAVPDIPPLAEVGVPGYDAVAWQMVVAPANTPKAIIAKLNAEMRAIVASPDVQEQFKKIGLITIDSPSPEELEKFVRAEIVRWGKVVAQSGARADF
jgi:tripartite-type tricarboxylate transporter receptor subunit TctC